MILTHRKFAGHACEELGAAKRNPAAFAKRRIKTSIQLEKMKTLLVILSCFCVLPALSIAQPIHLNPEKTEEPTATSTSYGGDVSILSTGDICQNCIWLQLSGEITEQTANLIIATLRKNAFVQRVHLDSPGGNLEAALELGRFIRSAGISTVVADSFEAQNAEGRFVYSVEPGTCASACVYLLAAGKDRSSITGSRIGVHQFAFAEGPTDASASEGLSFAQYKMSALTLYLDEMGVDPLIASIAAATPAEEIVMLSDAVLVESKLITRSPISSSKFLVQNPSGAASRAATSHLQDTDPFGDSERIAPTSPSACEQPHVSTGDRVKSWPGTIVRAVNSQEAVIVNRFWREVCRAYFNPPRYFKVTSDSMQKRWDAVYKAMQQPPTNLQHFDYLTLITKNDMNTQF